MLLTHHFKVSNFCYLSGGASKSSFLSQAAKAQREKFGLTGILEVPCGSSLLGDSPEISLTRVCCATLQDAETGFGLDRFRTLRPFSDQVR